MQLWLKFCYIFLDFAEMAENVALLQQKVETTLGLSNAILAQILSTLCTILLLFFVAWPFSLFSQRRYHPSLNRNRFRTIYSHLHK
jgi:hypothetical protein